MKEVDLDIIYYTSHTGYLTVCDNEENNSNGKVFASTSKQKTTNACVKENLCIFYDNEYNVFSRFDNSKQEHENSIKIVEIKQDSIVIEHRGYQQFININGKDIEECDKPFEIKVGETLSLRTNMRDIDKSYAIKVNKII